jgi:ketosteroid isomerase-like protein
MGGHPHTARQSKREAQFIQNMGAFMRRDFIALDESMRPDVVMELPGNSWLAGLYSGLEEVSRCVLGLRQVLISEEKQVSFLHEGDQMIVKHNIMVHSPTHEVEMVLRVRVRYDEDDRAKVISVEPQDLGLFDHVLNTLMRRQASA